MSVVTESIKISYSPGLRIVLPLESALIPNATDPNCSVVLGENSKTGSTTFALNVTLENEPAVWFGVSKEITAWNHGLTDTGIKSNSTKTESPARTMALAFFPANEILRISFALSKTRDRVIVFAKLFFNQKL